MLLGVDVGGTFTDAVLIDEAGAPHIAKVPSTPAREEVGVLDAVREVLLASGAHAHDVERFAHGMTVATNALLQGRTARTALVATEGFTDVIELARQRREHLYDLCRAAPPALVPDDLRFGAPERMTPEGALHALAPADARALAEKVLSAEPDAVAISLLHSYVDPTHERLIAAMLAELAPELHVSRSEDLVGTFREYERTATTALDAALSPALSSYLSRLADGAGDQGVPTPQIMQSSGGLTGIERAGAHAALTVLSGPAGGVGGALLLAGLAGESDVLCFDMGGTSCDVCLIAGGAVPETSDRTVGSRPVALPALDIHTVGAGGGSIAWRDAGGALRVGPDSAGADPGPACYGRGGERPTVTDANLLLGRLSADLPLAGGVRLDVTAALEAVSKLAGEFGLDPFACAEGIVRVAEAEMLGALRVMTVQRGIDPRGFALMPFGGAGPLHAAAMAAELGISRVLVPRASGVLSALGLAAAAPRRDAARTVMLAGATLGDARLDEERAALLAAAADALGVAPARLRVRHELRYRGQAFELAVDAELDPSQSRHVDPGASELRERFAAAHAQRYGYRDEHAEVELVNLRASAWGPAPSFAPPATGYVGGGSSEPATLRFAGCELAATRHLGAPEPGRELPGPAVCALPESTVLIPPGWTGRADQNGTIHLSCGERGAR